MHDGQLVSFCNMWFVSCMLEECLRGLGWEVIFSVGIWAIFISVQLSCVLHQVILLFPDWESLEVLFYIKGKPESQYYSDRDDCI